MKKLLYLSASALVLMGLASCLDTNDDPDYTAWREENTAWFEQMKDKEEDGAKYYEPYSPAWSPSSQILIHWHNNRALTASNLVPLSTSTVDVKYECRLMDGTVVDSSYSRKTPADSIYRTKPSANIIGWQALLTTMHVGDSVTCVIPASCAFGQTQMGNIKPYSTLVFDVKLVDIVAWEKPI